MIGLDYSDSLLISNILKIKTKYRVKLPDAIITATAITTGSALVTADKQLHNISEINIIVID